jgi:hypothetical protein
MSEQEVRALLGAPDEIELPPFPNQADSFDFRAARIFLYKVDSRHIQRVVFDEHGRVLKTGFRMVL